MATAQTQQKILRIGVIQGGKIIEERVIKKRETVTVGQGSKNTFVVPVSNLPSSFAIFEMKGIGYVLRFTDIMSGHVSSGEKKLDFAALKAQGLAKADREAFAVPLTDQSKGKISLGEITLLFQFVSPPPDVPRPVLPETARGSLWQTIDKVFFGILMGCLIVNFGSVKAITMRAPLPQDELTLEDLPDRFARIIVPDMPAPKKKEKVAIVKEEEKETPRKSNEEKAKPVVSKKTKPAPDPQARREAIAKGVADKGLLKMLGSRRGMDGEGAIENVLSAGSENSDIATALADAGGVSVATGESLGGNRRGNGAGTQINIGDLATSGGASGKAAKFAEKKTAQVKGRVIDQGPDVEASNCDRQAIARYVKRNLRAIQACYERALKRNVDLKGRVVIRFTIGEDGRVDGMPEIEEDSLSDPSVARCIRSTIRMWRFPLKDNECPVAYPFVFAPAS